MNLEKEEEVENVGEGEEEVKKQGDEQNGRFYAGFIVFILGFWVLKFSNN